MLRLGPFSDQSGVFSGRCIAGYNERVDVVVEVDFEGAWGAVGIAYSHACRLN